MLKQIFRSNIEPEKLYALLELCCIKTEKYYLLDNNAFRKMVFHDHHIDFFKDILDHYQNPRNFGLLSSFDFLITNNEL